MLERPLRFLAIALSLIIAIGFGLGYLARFMMARGGSPRHARTA